MTKLFLVETEIIELYGGISGIPSNNPIGVSTDPNDSDSPCWYILEVVFPPGVYIPGLFKLTDFNYGLQDNDSPNCYVCNEQNGGGTCGQAFIPDLDNPDYVNSSSTSLMVSPSPTQSVTTTPTITPTLTNTPSVTNPVPLLLQIHQI